MKNTKSETNAAIAEKVLVLHVKTGYENRAEHIERMLGKLQIPFVYILDGDIKDLTPSLCDKYFRNEGIFGMKNLLAQYSCAYKHFLAYEYILRNNLKGALILEDDAILQRRFVEVFNKCMQEYAGMDEDNILISFENSRLRFVPRSRRLKGKYLYRGDKDRMAAVYYINHEAARQILEYVRKNKCDRPIDLLHTRLLKEGSLAYYWCQPTVATQGSFTGKFASSISTKECLFVKLRWYFKVNYKKMLYMLR